MPTQNWKFLHLIRNLHTIIDGDVIADVDDHRRPL